MNKRIANKVIKRAGQHGGNPTDLFNATRDAFRRAGG